MKRPADALVAVLAAQAREYHGLLPILDQEEQFLLHADARALAPISELREALVTRLVALERDRTKALQALGADLGIDARLLTVPKLMELLPGQRAGARRGPERDLRASSIWPSETGATCSSPIAR